MKPVDCPYCWATGHQPCQYYRGFDIRDRPDHVARKKLREKMEANR